MNKQEKTKAAKKRGTLSWIIEFAGSKRSSYVFSVILAILSVVFGFIPYVFMANIVRGLLEKTADFSFCVTQCLWMALFFALDRLFHAASTTMSHKATFEVLANIRRRLTKKLAKMPLGDVLDESSGTYMIDLSRSVTKKHSLPLHGHENGQCFPPKLYFFEMQPPCNTLQPPATGCNSSGNPLKKQRRKASICALLRREVYSI